MTTNESLTYEQAVEELGRSIPDLQEACEREREWWGTETPGPHVFYHAVFVPYLEERLARDDDTVATSLRRVFGFVERLATSTDDRLRDLVGVTICKPLLGDHVRLGRAKSYMGPATLRILKEAQR